MLSLSQDKPERLLSVPGSLLCLFENSLKSAPDKTALIFEDQSLSFSELNLKATRLANAIVSRANEDNVIGVSCTPSIAMVVSVLAILKSGKAFMPLEPAFEDGKIKRMIAEVGLRHVIASENDMFFRTYGMEILSADAADTVFIQQASVADINVSTNAYVVYTSGSAGAAKGVSISHGALLNYLLHAIPTYGEEQSKGNGSFMHLSLSFDASLTALFVPLCMSKTLVIGSRRYKSSFNDPNFLKFAPYDFLKITPMQFFELEDVGEIQALKASKRFIAGGETLHSRHLSGFRKHRLNPEIINEYGPSETCIGCMTYHFNALDNEQDRPFGLPLGSPLQGVSISLLNEELKPVQAGKYGEIVIGGVQVAAGYLDGTGAGSQKFFKGEEEAIFYRTGDYARQDEAGLLEFVCREDKFGSVHAKSFNTCIVEHEIMAIPGIRNVLVAVGVSPDGHEFPVCYIQEFKQNKNRASLRENLFRLFGERNYRVLLIFVNHFPLTFNKKTDRKKLSLIDWSNNFSEFLGKKDKFDKMNVFLVPKTVKIGENAVTVMPDMVSSIHIPDWKNRGKHYANPLFHAQKLI